LPRRCAPRNDGRGGHCACAPSCAPDPSLRGTKQSTAALAQARGLPRRCAPRNDGRGGHCACAPSCAPALSLRGTKQSIAALAQALGLPRRCAPRNDERGVIARLTRHCDDCHVAALLAMTEAIHCGLAIGTWIATALRASQ
jgi:hypothetical protein